MERKVPFETGETYHLYTRGVEKRIVFTSQEDYERMLLLLMAANQPQSVRVNDLLRGRSQGEPLRTVYESFPRGEHLTAISGFALMPTHLHLLVTERETGGISKFMSKLMTAYSMYFNTKYERSGPLFTRPFRSRHIDTDDYFRWVFAYVHLNPLEMFQSDWKTHGLHDRRAASDFLSTHRYSSFTDYFGRERVESRILTRPGIVVPHGFDELLDTLTADVPENTTAHKLPSGALV